jgi:hypothetical protein
MGRKSAKLNVASLVGRPHLDDRTIHWPQIEQAYGHSIPGATRSKIINATNQLLEFSAFALAARPLAELIDHLKVLGICGGNLLNELTARFPRRGQSPDSCEVESVSAANIAIERHLKLLSAARPYTLEMIADMLSCLIVACKRAEKDFVDPPGEDESKPASLDEALHWAQWIRRLTTILTEANLPTAASKGADKSKLDKPSPFVALVYELHRYIPNAKFHSDGALTQAITRARRTR